MKGSTAHGIVLEIYDDNQRPYWYFYDPIHGDITTLMLIDRCCVLQSAESLIISCGI